jgi:hypothetical protein
MMLLFVMRPAVADEVTIISSKDNTLYEVKFGVLSNGAGNHFFCGRTGTDAIRRGLLLFDVASAVPAGSTVNSVTLTLRMSQSNNAPTTMCGIHRVQQHWGEEDSIAEGGEGSGALALPGDATWLHTFFDTQIWNNEGGDFDPDPLATQSVAGVGFYSWSSPALTALVQQWVQDPSQNFGLLLHGDETFFPSAKRFDTREIPTVANRPKLLINYTPPPACPADLTGDSAVGAADLGELLAQWGQCGQCAADIAPPRGDGVVGAADLGELLAGWGPCS